MMATWLWRFLVRQVPVRCPCCNCKEAGVMRGRWRPEGGTIPLAARRMVLSVLFPAGCWPEMALLCGCPLSTWCGSYGDAPGGLVGRDSWHSLSERQKQWLQEDLPSTRSATVPLPSHHGPGCFSVFPLASRLCFPARGCVACLWGGSLCCWRTEMPRDRGIHCALCCGRSRRCPDGDREGRRWRWRLLLPTGCEELTALQCREPHPDKKGERL